MILNTSTDYKKTLWQTELYQGIKSAIPISIGYLPIAMTFGLLAKNAGLSIINGALMSAFVFAGASQFVAVNMLSLSMGWMEIVLTTFVLNFRHFLMSASLIQRIKSKNPFWLWIIGFGVTDESFAVASLQERQILPPSYLLGLNFTAYFSWLGGTVLGYLIAGVMPLVIQSSMGIALYAMFIGLLIPSVKKSFKIGIIAALGALANIGLSSYMSLGWALVLGAVLAAIAASFIFKEV